MNYTSTTEASKAEPKEISYVQRAWMNKTNIWPSRQGCSKWTCFWYAAKAIICVWLGWTSEEDIVDDHDGFAVAYWGEHKIYTMDYTCDGWTVMVVGCGLFSNWVYSVYDDQSA